MSNRVILQESPSIKTTERGSEFFLWAEPLTNPMTLEEEKVAFVVVHRPSGADPFDAAIMLLFQAAHMGQLPWEAAAAAVDYAESRPAATDVPGRRKRIARRGSIKSLTHALQREEKREFLSLPLGEPCLFIHQQVEKIVAELRDVDHAFAFAEFGGGAYGQPLRRVPSFAGRGSVLGEALMSGKLDYEEFVEALRTAAVAGKVNLHPFLGSRYLHQALSALFQVTLEDIQHEFPDDWELIPPEGRNLQNFMHRIPGTGTAGALPLLPHLNDREDSVDYRMPGPMEFVTAQLRSPSLPELLATAAFQPEQLGYQFQRVAAASILELQYTATDSRAESDALDHRVYVGEGDDDVDPLDFQTAKGSLEELLQFFKYECRLTERQADVLASCLGGENGRDVAKRLKLSPGWISQIKDEAAAVAQDACKDPERRRRLLQLVGVTSEFRRYDGKWMDRTEEARRKGRETQSE